MLLERVENSRSTTTYEEHPPSTSKPLYFKSNRQDLRHSRPILKKTVIPVKESNTGQRLFFSSIGLRATNSIPILSIKKSVDHTTGAPVFTLARKAVSASSVPKEIPQTEDSSSRQSISSSNAMLLSPGIPTLLLERITLNSTNTNPDEAGESNLVDELLHVDLCSPMGVKLKSLLASHCDECSTIRHYDSYCNQVQTKSDSRSLRSQTSYCKFKHQTSLVLTFLG